MSHLSKIRIYSTKLIVFAYIFLFVYAALNKVIDFENFQVQLAQSPLLSYFAEIVSYLIPSIEFIIVLLYLIPRFQFAALLSSFCLMVMFSTYIFIMLHFSPFIPCSCGGILDKMSWNQHLIFNLIFVLLSVLAIIIMPSKNITNTNAYIKRIATLIPLFMTSIAAIALLFILSEDMIRHRNNFTRRFPHHPASIAGEMDLKLNSYYIAGIANGKIYLGNYTSPLTVTVLDTALHNKKIYAITVPDPNKSYHSLKVSIRFSYFYLADGNSPFIYKGLVSDWKAKPWMENLAFFTLFEPIEENQGAIRALDSKNHENVLGIIRVKNENKLILNKQLLVKQIDGVFDTGGTMNYNEQLQKLIYTYSYRNQYLIIDKNLKNKDTGTTIDTTSQANIKVRYISSLQGSKMASPVKQVNITTATYGTNLFVKAGLIGKFEPKEMWEEASIIDIYNLNDKSYVFSFYIHHKRDKKMRHFRVEDNFLFALVGNHIVRYEFERGILPTN